jgi:pentose-5-phosphate-3-epimerase
VKPIIVAASILAADPGRANAIVAGSAIFGAVDYAAAVRRKRNSALHEVVPQ